MYQLVLRHTASGNRLSVWYRMLKHSLELILYCDCVSLYYTVINIIYSDFFCLHHVLNKL